MFLCEFYGFVYSQPAKSDINLLMRDFRGANVEFRETEKKLLVK